MTAKRIEVHLDKNDDTRDQVIEAFGKRFIFHGIVSRDITSKDVVVVYLPEKEDNS